MDIVHIHYTLYIQPRHKNEISYLRTGKTDCFCRQIHAEKKTMIKTSFGKAERQPMHRGGGGELAKPWVLFWRGESTWWGIVHLVWVCSILFKKIGTMFCEAKFQDSIYFSISQLICLSFQFDKWTSVDVWYLTYLFS